jgi:hypothetical protein
METEEEPVVAPAEEKAPEEDSMEDGGEGDGDNNEENTEIANELPPNHTLYVNNLNERVKTEGMDGWASLLSF